LTVERSGPVASSAEAAPEPPAAPKQPLPPEPEISPSTQFTGAILRQLREARGIDLHAISQKTKITVGHLRALEDETVKALPAQVYVRGFLLEYARFLRLDVTRVLETYLARVKAMRAEVEEDRE
jgi:flagellar biosynthesis protein FlhG